MWKWIQLIAADLILVTNENWIWDVKCTQSNVLYTMILLSLQHNTIHDVYCSSTVQTFSVPNHPGFLKALGLICYMSVQDNSSKFKYASSYSHHKWENNIISTITMETVLQKHELVENYGNFRLISLLQLLYHHIQMSFYFLSDDEIQCFHLSGQKSIFQIISNMKCL